MTGLNHNLITQRFKLNNKAALITGMSQQATCHGECVAVTSPTSTQLVQADKLCRLTLSATGVVESCLLKSALQQLSFCLPLM